MRKQNTWRGNLGFDVPDFPGPSFTLKDPSGNNLLTVSSAGRCTTSTSNCDTPQKFAYIYTIKITNILPQPITLSIDAPFFTADNITNNNIQLDFGIALVNSFEQDNADSSIALCEQSLDPATCYDQAVRMPGAPTSPGPFQFTLDPTNLQAGDVIVVFVESQNPPDCTPAVNSLSQLCVPVTPLSVALSDISGGSQIPLQSSGALLIAPVSAATVTSATALTPSLTSISPTTISASGVALTDPNNPADEERDTVTTIIISGSNFVNGQSFVKWDAPSTTDCTNLAPSSLATGFISNTQLTAAVPFDLITSAGTHILSVCNVTDDSIPVILNSPQQMTLTVSGPVSVSTVTPSLGFGGQKVATSSEALPIVIVNRGGAPLSLSSFTVQGDQAEFAIDTSSCVSVTLGSPLGSDKTKNSGVNRCTIPVVFTPGNAGLRRATLVITDDAGVPGPTQTVPMSGIGTTDPDAVTAPTSLDFGPQVLNTPAVPRSITLHNPGGLVLSIAGIAITPSSPADFSETNDCGSSLAAAATCTISVAFAPTTAGTRNASLVISDNAHTGATQTIPLTGVGADFSVPSAGDASLSATTAAGGSASFTIPFSGLNGFVGDISFTCSDPPSGTSCTPTPNPLNLSGTQAQNVTVSIVPTTKGNVLSSAVSALSSFSYTGALRLSWLWGVCPLVFVVLFRRTLKSTPTRTFLAATAAIFVLGFAAGCGGGDMKPPPPAQVFPAKGDYTIHLKAVSGSDSHTIALTLHVQ